MVRVELAGQGGQATDALLSPRPDHLGTGGRDLHQHRPAVRGVRGPHGQAVPLDPAFSDERRLDAVEQLIPLAEEAGLSMPHLAMAFAISHPGVTSALLGARTMEQLDELEGDEDAAARQPSLGHHSLRFTAHCRATEGGPSPRPASYRPMVRSKAAAGGSCQRY